MSISHEETAAYLSTVGKRGFKMLELIQVLRPVVEMAQTEPGQTLIREDVMEHAGLLNDIYKSLIEKGTAEQKDVIKLQLLDTRLKRLYDRIKAYSEGVSQVKNANKTERKVA